MRCEDCVYFHTESDGYCSAEHGAALPLNGDIYACRHFRPVNRGCSNCRFTVADGINRRCVHGLHVWEWWSLRGDDLESRLVNDADMPSCCFWEHDSR
jgi:hypothetical protein